MSESPYSEPQPAPASWQDFIRVPDGKGQFLYRDPAFPEWNLTVYTYRPAGLARVPQVVFVQHGFARNGRDYRDFWSKAADRYHLLIIAPTFDDEQFPGTDNYNDGTLLRLSPAEWHASRLTYSILPRLWEALQRSGVRSRTAPVLFGHSAGGQFTHRFLATQGLGPFSAVLPANPGWYTLPSLERDFPEGLGGIGLDDDAVIRWLAAPMHLFAGDQDNASDARNLPLHEAARRQGASRYERAHFFFRFAQEEARRRGVACHWQFTTVPGIGHDAKAMSNAAADWLFGRQNAEEPIRNSDQPRVLTGSSAP